MLLEEDRVNVCDSCTDCVLHGDRFVPMCILESLKEGDAAVTASVSR